ncbi:MAG: hypothetical protein D8M57_10645 [Candidatus Scalindua sp. AMX11]|nr:MAG: hypothetical protein DWQ00_03360 [Candidatus Scalindua sp.]TDE64907.1 MAG: hypothetical protein D8M57_10645 [Candidatus Scalindua sp. AMX11]
MLPAVVLIRDWKFHDRRTKNHHNITRIIIAIWCISSIAATIYVWVDSAQINELIEGKNTLITQNKNLSKKIDKYQEYLIEKDKEITELKSKAKKSERGIFTNYLPDGHVREVVGGSTSMKITWVEVSKQMWNLHNQDNFIELKNLCIGQIKKSPEWPIPYLLLSVALTNLGDKHQAIKNLKYFLEIAPTEPSLGYDDYRDQAENLIKKLQNL